MKDQAIPCAFRILSEGLPLLLPHITRQMVHCSPPDFRRLLTERSLTFDAFEDPELVKALRGALMGCLILKLNRGGRLGGWDGGWGMGGWFILTQTCFN